MELILKDFSTGYSKNKVVNKINFKLKNNEWIGIIGANGSGTVSYTHLTLPTKQMV